uniref:Uncharacterized protein n=1 Tax=Brassica campestris TaxID=3711 RepID=M4DPH1_BRACM
MEPLSPMSQMLSSPNLFIVITFGFKTKCNPSAFVEGFKTTLINAPRFSSKMVINYKKNGEPVWIPVSIRIEDHVTVPDLDYPNIENPDQFLEDYTSRIANIPMDMSKPLWELHLLNIKTSNAESVLLAKIHHSVGDGMSLMSLLLACSRKTSDPSALISNTSATKKPVKSMISAWWLIAGLWFMIRVTFTTLVEFFKLMLTTCFLRDTKNPLMGNPDDGIQSWKVIHRIISFDDVKLVKNTMNMKVNDVLLGMTQAGLSRYLTTKYVEAFGKRIFGNTSLAFSNVKGPDEEISLFGHPISYVAGSALVGSQALNIHFISYVNKIIINLAVDTTTIPDPHQLCDEIVEALKIIKSAVQEKRSHNMEAHRMKTRFTKSVQLNAAWHHELDTRARPDNLDLTRRHELGLIARRLSPVAQPVKLDPTH